VSEKKTHAGVFFDSFFFAARFMVLAIRYILQKCLNWKIGICLLEKRWYNF